MEKNNIIWLLLLLTISFVSAQTKDLKGQLTATDDVEGIHILNRTAAKYAISNEDGAFVIPAKELDTLVISGLKYKMNEIVISKSIMAAGNFNVELIDKINELDEVRVGKFLTGSLQSDLENSDAKTEINFYDLGIPGYKGKPLTQKERRLYDADGGSWGYVGLGFGLNFHKLLNTISGRTKKLKLIVDLEDKTDCINRIRREYSEAIFESDNLAENLRNEYFIFCEEDERFLKLCSENNDLQLIDFLKEKLKAYKQNRLSATKD